MKNLAYFFIAILSFAFTGCEPMEDIHEQVDTAIENRDIQGNVNYTLNEDDYAELDLAYGSFNSLDDARALIPNLLDSKYPVWGDGSLVNVTFDLYDPVRVQEYTVASSDYAAIGLSVDYFSGTSEIQDFLEYQFPQAEEGSYVELTYYTLADEIGYTFDNDDFDLIGDELGDKYPEPASSAANYNNFDRRESNDAYWSQEMIVEAVNVVLSENVDDVEGQKYNVSYAVYDGSAGTESMTVLFDGNSYVLVGGAAYDLTNADFDLIGEKLGDVYPDPASSAAQYNNFDRRSNNDAYWSSDMLLEALNIVLEENFPSAVEGDKFEVSFRIYNGSSGTEIISVVRSGDKYIVDTEASVSTIEETTVFAYTNGDWNVPFTLEREDYIEMGQSYPNFGDEDEALYKIAIFLEKEYPYAEEGDFIAVAYDLFSGGVSTKYVNYVFEGGEGNHIPSVIAQSLQFGHDGTAWVPDNTITYTLTDADFSLIGDAFEDIYVDQAWSAGNYGNFDRRQGNVNYWSKEMIVEALNVVLDDIHPGAEEGQQYVVSYAIYDGSAGMESLRVIKEGGEWILNE